MTEVVLTARDMDMLAFIALHRECSLELLAAKFFARNPYTGEVNSGPAKECMRRINKLKRHGYVDAAPIVDGRKKRVLVRPMSRAHEPLDERAAHRMVNPKERVHHLKTLDAIERVEADLRRRGARLVEFRVEAAIRADALRGRRTRRGDSFDAFPDAVCTIAIPTPTGERIERIAVEYVTSKYCDADIVAKHQSFSETYDGALWFADRGRTAARVQRATGAPCSVMN